MIYLAARTSSTCSKDDSAMLSKILFLSFLYVGRVSSHSDQILTTKMLLNYREKGEAEITQFEKKCKVVPDAINGTCKRYILDRFRENQEHDTVKERLLLRRKCINPIEMDELMYSGRLDGILLDTFVEHKTVIPPPGYASLMKQGREVQLCLSTPVYRICKLYESKRADDPFPLAAVFNNTPFTVCHCTKTLPSRVFKCSSDCHLVVSQKNDTTYMSGFLKTHIFFLFVGFCVLICYCLKSKNINEKDSKLTLLPLLSSDPELVSSCNVVKKNSLKRGKMVGKGTFAHVYMMNYCRKLVAFKVFRRALKILGKKNKLPCSMMLVEAELKCAEERPDLFVQYLVAVYAKERLHGIVVELMYGNLNESVIQKHSLNYGAKETYLWTLQIAKGMKYLHERQLIHKDIKPTNLMVDKDLSVCKIGDLGIVRRLDESRFGYNNGKPKYCATEVVSHFFQFIDFCYSFASDIFSFGITMWDIVHHGKHENEKFHSVQNLSIRPSIDKGLDVADLGKLIIRCWHPDPFERPTIHEIVDELERRRNYYEINSREDTTREIQGTEYNYRESVL